MPLTVALERENGEMVERIEDNLNMLRRLLPKYGTPDYCCLSYIDWYGDTIFNRLQMEPFLAEWERVRFALKTSEERALFAAIEQLAQRCQREAHLYLKFYGD